eukprot:TRINITY_DN3220_c0_g1_i1.p1 TRINITY_DN3220_c0_g1~~TRINITY_DN3220_c0_g1_i1.p1  ORF type:complete len:434 (-),score=47.05 TRINITY_DN3220_c0_g1_i1:56-1357(-)
MRYNPSKNRRNLLLVLVGVIFLLFLIPYPSPSEEHSQPKKIKSAPPSSATQQKEGNSQQSPNQIDLTMSHSNLKKSKVHVFYYPWYANLEFDGEWNHWNHNILPHWNSGTRESFRHDVNYIPPDDIGSVFYPARGPYSSSDPSVLDQHMEELQEYVVVISWWGQGSNPNSKDGEGFVTDSVVPKILKSAEKYGTKIAFHLEPYPGRTAKSVREDMIYLISKYGSSPSFYRDEERGNRPVIYIYDSYLTTANEWASILDSSGARSIRGTEYDFITLGLYTTRSSGTEILHSKFDGIYTYFAADDFTEGSTAKNWGGIVQFCHDNSMIVSISIGPGYDDTRVRPWNSGNKKSRKDGRYYDEKWQTAINAKPDYISITSYNEWMEGTQIEPAIPRSISKTVLDDGPYIYDDYGSLPYNYYIQKTLEWSKVFHSHDS